MAKHVQLIWSLKDSDPIRNQDNIYVHFMSQTTPFTPAMLIDTNSEICTESERQRDIYNSHRHHVYSVAYYMTGNEMEAEKILEDTFIQTFRKNVASQQEPGLEQVDRALLTQLQQRFSLAMSRETAQPADNLNAVSTGSAFVGNVRRTDMEEAVQSLPDTERLLFLLRDVEGYTPERIAELLSCPVANVRQTVHAARIHMRQQLSMRPVRSAEWSTESV